MNSKKRIISLCCGLLTAALPIAAKTFTLPPYETKYPSCGTLFSLWRKNHGEVFQKAYDEIYEAITTGKDKYQYNNDDDKKQWRLGCFNAYFGTSLWRSRPNLTAGLKRWLATSGHAKNDWHGGKVPIPIYDRAPKDLGVRVPEFLSIKGEKPTLNPGIRRIAVASDMDYMLGYFSWCLTGREDEETIVQYARDCLCVLMSEEFLRKIFTDRMVDLLLDYQRGVVDKKKAKESDGRRLRICYHVSPIEIPYKNAPNRLGFSVKMHLYDIHESPNSNDFDDLYYKEGESGCIRIPCLDRPCSLDTKGAVRSRKNLSITLKFIFDAESKQLCAVGLKEQIVVNASLVLSIGKNASLPLFLKQL